MSQWAKQVAFNSNNLLEPALLNNSRILHLVVNGRMHPAHLPRRETAHLSLVVRSHFPIMLDQTARPRCRSIAVQVQVRVSLLALKLVLRVKSWVQSKNRSSRMPVGILMPGTSSR